MVLSNQNNKEPTKEDIDYLYNILLVEYYDAFDHNNKRKGKEVYDTITNFLKTWYSKEEIQSWFLEYIESEFPKEISDKQTWLDHNKERHYIEATKDFDLKIDVSRENDEAWEYMRDFISYPKRFKYIKQILDYLIVNETDIKYLLYLLLWGNQFKQLRSYIYYEGESSAGKSYVTDNVLKLIDQDRIFKISDVTEAGLRDSPELDPNSKVDTLYIPDYRRFNHGINNLMKETYGVEKATYRRKEQDEKGRWELKDQTIGGKGWITTSNHSEIPDAVRNRCWSFTPNESEKQTKEITRRDLKREGNIPIHNAISKTIERQIEFINYAYNNTVPRGIEDFEVFIPYASQIEPIINRLYSHLRLRRDVGKLKQLIKISALWHQRLRNIIRRGDKNYLIATPEDLYFILDIGSRFFFETVQELTEAMKGILSFMESKTESSGLDGKVEYKKLRFSEIEKIGIDYNKSGNTLRTLLEKKLGYRGYIKVIKKGSGSATLYQFQKSFKNISLDIEKLKPAIQDSYEINLQYWLNSTDIMVQDEAKMIFNNFLEEVTE